MKMFDVGLNELQQILREGRIASQYARENYEKFASRPTVYTLYGGEAYGVGVEVPSSFTPKNARKLSSKNRRKNYVVYELDEHCNSIRTIHMIDYNRVDCTYYHFFLDEVHYAYPFRGEGSDLYTDEIIAIKYEYEKPLYFACIRKNFLFVQFYEYSSDEKMIVSTYRYWPTAKHTIHGYPVDWNAPLGAPNSPVQRHCTEETPEFVDFSYWTK